MTSLTAGPTQVDREHSELRGVVVVVAGAA
jgi:hypothetical protein